PSGSASFPGCSSASPCCPPTSWETGSGTVTIREEASEPMNDRQRSESFLERLVAVPSVSGDEAAIVTVCRDLMAEVGLATRFRPCAGVEGPPNVEGVLGPPRPQPCLARHLHTLPLQRPTLNPLPARPANRYSPPP